MNEIPAGFVPLERPSPFLYTVGPLFISGDGGEQEVIGLRIEEKHTNTVGIAHGGVLAALADVALGHRLVFSTRPPRTLVTINLTLDFIGSAGRGAWLEARVEIHKQEGRMAFASARLSAGDRQVVRASGIFMLGKPLDV